MRENQNTQGLFEQRNYIDLIQFPDWTVYNPVHFELKKSYSCKLGKRTSNLHNILHYDVWEFCAFCFSIASWTCYWHVSGGAVSMGTRRVGKGGRLHQLPRWSCSFSARRKNIITQGYYLTILFILLFFMLIFLIHYTFSRFIPCFRCSVWIVPM